MALPPHLQNLQKELNNLNLPKILPNFNNINEQPDNNNKKNSSQQPNQSHNQLSNSNSNNQNNNHFEKPKKKNEIPKNLKKKWKTLRRGAGVVWEDKSLAEWPDNDYRIFCGDLGNEVNDQILYNAFSKYQSLQKAKIIRDKNTLKSKGYGFVSFLDVNDYIQAMREMNGKYVGNRPITLKRSKWKDRSILYNKSHLEGIKFLLKKRERKNTKKLPDNNIPPMTQMNMNVNFPNNNMNNQGQPMNENNNQNENYMTYMNNNVTNNNPIERVSQIPTQPYEYEQFRNEIKEEENEYEGNFAEGYIYNVNYGQAFREDDEEEEEEEREDKKK